MIRWVLAAGLLAACAGEPGANSDAPDGDVVDVSFAEHVEPLLFNCTGCHQGAAPDGGFDLSGDLYETLVEQPSMQSEGLLLVEPGDAAYSYLWHKINGSQSLAGGAGTRMPLGERWPEEDIELLGLWIDLGAAP